MPRHTCVACLCSSPLTYPPFSPWASPSPQVLLLARCWDYRLKTEDVLELCQGNRRIALCTVSEQSFQSL